MASNKTPNLNLDVWSETDYFKRVELNNNFTKIDTKVKDNSDKIVDLSSNKAEKTYVDTELAKKTTKTYVDQQISNIGNASPKGTYTTLVALQTAFPTGTTGIYVVTADGKWYYWNGTTWTAGGVYQAVGLSDASVTKENTNFIKVGYNKMKTSDAYVDKFIKASGKMEDLQASTGQKTTKPIVVEPNKEYTIRFNVTFAFNECDSAGNIIQYRHSSVLGTRTFTFTTTATTKYIQASYANTATEFSLVEGSYTHEEDYSEKLANAFEISTKDIDNNYYKNPDERIKAIESSIKKFNPTNAASKYGEYFAYIKDGFLRCDKVVDGGKCISYNGTDLGADDKKPWKALFQVAFENKPNNGSATATIISTKLGMRRVANITNKSLHICFGQTTMHVDLFDNDVFTSFYNYTYATPCVKDEKTLHTIGWEYINSTSLKIYMPDGTRPVINLPAGKNINDYCGRYNIFEHYTENDDGSVSRALYKKALIWTADDTFWPQIYDDFNKPDGHIGVTRSGHTYSQFILNNSDYGTI